MMPHVQANLPSHCFEGYLYTPIYFFVLLRYLCMHFHMCAGTMLPLLVWVGEILAHLDLLLSKPGDDL